MSGTKDDGAILLNLIPQIVKYIVKGKHQQLVAYFFRQIHGPIRVDYAGSVGHNGQRGAKAGADFP
jgi:hypothetical protein